MGTVTQIASGFREFEASNSCHLKDRDGDAANVVLAALDHNFRDQFEQTVALPQAGIAGAEIYQWRFRRAVQIERNGSAFDASPLRLIRAVPPEVAQIHRSERRNRRVEERPMPLLEYW